jgi:hypothetical protein
MIFISNVASDEAATFWLQSNRPEGSLWRSPDLDLAESYYSQNY